MRRRSYSRSRSLSSAVVEKKSSSLGELVSQTLETISELDTGVVRGRGAVGGAETLLRNCPMHQVENIAKNLTSTLAEPR